MKSKFLKVAVVVATLTFASNAMAEVTGEIPLTAEVTGACNITAGPLIDFGSINKNTSSFDFVDSNYIVNCNVGTEYGVGIVDNHALSDYQGSAIADGGQISRDATNHIDYVLYSGSGGVAPWVDEPSTAHVATGEDEVHVISAKLTPVGFQQQGGFLNVPAGTYDGSMLLTVNF